MQHGQTGRNPVSRNQDRFGGAWRPRAPVAAAPRTLRLNHLIELAFRSGPLRGIMAAICVTLVAACGGSSGGSAPSMYTIGVSVSGLSGSGLVLQLSTGGTLVVAADGNATFATAVAAGTSYKVTVKTQPSSPTQTCTVANGSGTIGSANVTGIAITCVTASYTVGVTVSGLSGSGLVLQLNGGNNLSITANGNAAFPAAVSSGATYAVIVKAQPTLPAQTCSVANGSGTISAANVTNVSITCVTSPVAASMVYFTAGNEYGSNPNGTEGWLSYVFGYPANSNGPVDPAVTIASLNSVLRYSSVATDSFGYLYVAVGPAFGGSSGAEVWVFAPTASGMAQPVRTISVPPSSAIAVDGAGNIYVSTISAAGSNAILEFAAGASGNVAPIRTINNAAAYCLPLAVDGNGNIVCVPNNPNGPNEIQLFTSGQSGNATPARTISLGNLLIIDVSFDPSGNIYVATLSQVSGVSILEFQGGADGTDTGSPVSSITSSVLLANLTLRNLRFDAAGNLYVFGNLNILLRFAAGPNGFAPPTFETLTLPPVPPYNFLITGFAVH
jgi:hypothetical protein